ncbi:MAG: RnfABCDGE type electron transport complex subunit B [Candidatus Omnitrophica bacterium]|nr:RnfABCDGE type electron transport complex subunit B [Candidatus Omnitrophota bacterium]
MDILLPVMSLGLLGLLFGIGLAFASKKFEVKVDPRLEKIQGILPGVNCGACGQAGCAGFAEALLEGKVLADGCKVADDKVKEAIAVLLGQKLEKKIKKVARLRCNGGKKVKDRFIYKGVKDCLSAKLHLGGQKQCLEGCLGFGTCAKACPFSAITMSEEGLPVVDIQKCKACNKCAQVCPKKLFSLVPINNKVIAACSLHEPGKDTKTVCPVGCIACKICEKACKYDAIHVIDYLAVIDHNKCTSCGECVKVCPAKTITIVK